MPGYKPTKQSDDPFADLDDLDKRPLESPTPTPPPRSPDKPAPPSSKPGEPATKTEPPAAPTPDPKNRTPKELRQSYDTAVSELKTSQSRIQELETKLAELEASPGKTERLEAHVSEQIEKHKKAAEAAERKLELMHFEESSDYQRQFEEPYNQAYNAAKEDIQQLMVKFEDGTSRQATERDLNYILRLPLQSALEKAEELFGKAGSIIITHKQAIDGIIRSRNAAVAKHRAEFDDYKKAEGIRIAQEREARHGMWTKVNKELGERFAHFRPTIETDANHDAEANALLQKGFQEADTFFNNRGTLTPQEQVLLDARIRNQSAAFRPTIHRLKKAEARIAELEAKLKEFNDSEPDDPRRNADTEAIRLGQKPKTWEEGIDALPER